MTTVTLDPNADGSTTGATSTAGNFYSVLADSSDSTYFSFTAGFGVVPVALGTSTLTSGFRAKSLAVSVRGAYLATTGADFSQVQVLVGQGTTLATYLTVPVFFSSTSATTTSTGSVALPAAMAQTDVDALFVRLSGGPSTQDYARIYKVQLSLTYATKPTCAITAPTGTPAYAVSRPTATWTHTAGSDGGPQTFYQVKCFTAAQYGGGGFDASTSTADYDSGVLTGSATSHQVGALANSTTYRMYVRTAQSINGVAHWSDWDFEGFTTSWTASAITSIAGVATSASGYITVTTTRTGGGNPAWDWTELERSDDAGTTWVPVRGATEVGVTNTFTTFGASTSVTVDYEAPPGVACLYRARTMTDASGSEVVSAWSTSSSVEWTNTVVWFKDPHDPTQNMTLPVREQPAPTRSRVQGVHQVIGAQFPVVTSDVAQSAAGTFIAQTGEEANTKAQNYALATAFLDCLHDGGAVRLIQFPDDHVWGSRYVSLGDVVEELLDPTAEADGFRRWDIAFTEVAMPADHVDY